MNRATHTKMMAEDILILGGYGSTGLLIAQFLLSQTDVSLALAGRRGM
jgi:short subunit dehydrogenase-like uncharacterized protein